MGSPTKDGVLTGVVVWKVVPGLGDGQVFLQIAFVFAFEGNGVVFRMVEDVEPAGGFVANDIEPRFTGFGQDIQFVHLFDVVAAHFRVAAHGNSKLLVKAPQEDRVPFYFLVGE